MTAVANKLISIEKIELNLLVNKGFDDLLALVKKVDIRDSSTESIHNYFFSWCNQERLNLSQGVVKHQKPFLGS